MATSYDEVPYDSKPLFSTHPDCLAAAARLRQLPAASPSRCRVLELGCADGGNLIPMAYGLPESRFLGIDLSPRQIADGQRLCQQLELTNIELRAVSITDVDASWGTFDYIICHGVYSWVPPPVQERILWICQHLLAPNGVAYVSYNTYPGWHLQLVIRELMKYHTARFDDPATKVQQARSILRFMCETWTSIDSPLAKLFADDVQSLDKAPDYYIYHEHLEDSNQPLFFHEFVARARGHGLEYLGEAWHHTQIDNLPSDVQEALQAISSDLVDLEQFADFIRSRTFRRTLLCRQEARPVITPNPAVMEPMLLTALARPDSESPDIASLTSEKFRLDDDRTATTNMPILKAALVALYRQWPAAVPFAELLDSVVHELAMTAEKQTVARPLLASMLVRAYVANLVAIHCEPFPMTTRVSQRPRASKLARVIARDKSRVATLRHRLAELSAVDRVIIRLADGTRSVEQIAAEAEQSAGATLTDQLATSRGGADWQALTAESLQRFARWALLEA